MDISKLKKAAKDLRFLLDRGYPRKASINLVGNRYNLDSNERHLLHRGIFSKKDSISRLKKKITLRDLKGKKIAIDGYNVLITIEAGLSGRALVSGDDGFIRDISGISKNYKMSEKTSDALRLILDVLNKIKPCHTLFLFDSPISRSGKLAWEVKDLLKKEKLPGDALAIRVPEHILIGFQGIVATSDTDIIDKSKRIIDLAGNILRRNKLTKSILRF